MISKNDYLNFAGAKYHQLCDEGELHETAYRIARNIMLQWLIEACEAINEASKERRGVTERRKDNNDKAREVGQD